MLICITTYLINGFTYYIENFFLISMTIYNQIVSYVNYVELIIFIIYTN